jgi:glycosyltransferase involved in cell wall biosynthesis
MTTHLYFYRRSIDIIICRLFNVKIILHLRGGRFIRFYENNLFVGKVMIKFILKMSNRIVALSEFWRKYLATITDAGRITVIPNGVPRRDFHQLNNVRRQIGCKEEAVVALFLSPLGRAKGAFDILETIPMVVGYNQNVYFIFCGWEGSAGEMKEFESLIDKYGVGSYAKCVGPVLGQEKIDYYMSSDIFLLPSYADNLPNALLEAMAAGLPAIASDVGAIPEIIQDGFNGFIIKAGDVEKMTERILTLANDQAMRKEMGKINLRLVREKYDIALVAEKIDDLYRGMIGE